MDDSRFDHLARSASAVPSRRALLGLLLGAAGAALAGVAAPVAAGRDRSAGAARLARPEVRWQRQKAEEVLPGSALPGAPLPLSAGTDGL